MFRLQIRGDEKTGKAMAVIVPEFGDGVPVTDDDIIKLAMCNMALPQEVAELFKEFCIKASKIVIQKILDDVTDGKSKIAAMVIEDPVGTAAKYIPPDTRLVDNPDVVKDIPFPHKKSSIIQ